jgi:hypothetical protein
MTTSTLLAPESFTFERQTSSAKTVRPLRVAFVITSMPVGGAETLLVNLIRGMDRSRFEPEIICLKELGPLGEIMAMEIQVLIRCSVVNGISRSSPNWLTVFAKAESTR